MEQFNDKTDKGAGLYTGRASLRPLSPFLPFCLRAVDRCLLITLTNSYKHKRVDIIIINKQLIAKLANEKPSPLKSGQ